MCKKQTDTNNPPYLHSTSSQLIVSHPIPPAKTLNHYFLIYAIFPVLAPAFIAFKSITNSDFRKTSFSLYSLVSGATANPITKEWYFQDKELLDILWSKVPSAKCYVDDAIGEPRLEYQLSEGYCGSATQRCILRSFGLSPESIPAQKNGETKPGPWCEHVCQMAKEATEGNMELETTIVGGDVDYYKFLETLRETAKEPEKSRIAVNFLRPALTGFSGFRFFPMNFILGLLGGHFSPVLGLIENDTVDQPSSSIREKIDGDNPLVAIWDTNHKYGGAYFVPAKRLYESVKALDLSSNKNRALIVVKKK